MSNQYPTGYPPVPVSSGLMNSPHSYTGSPGPMSAAIGPGMGPGMVSGMNPALGPGMNAGLPSGGGSNIPSGMGMHGLQTGMASGMPSVLSSALGGSITAPIASRMSPVIGPGMPHHSIQGMHGPVAGGMAVSITSGMTPMPMQYSLGSGPNNSSQGPPNMVQGPAAASAPNSAACDSAAVAGAGVAAPTRLATPNTSQENASAAQSSRDINTASLCRIGQETVQDIVSRTLEIYQTLKPIQPPNGTAAGANAANERKSKVQEQLRTIRKLFIGLRLVYEKCNDNSQLQGLEYTHIESLIPLKDEWDGKIEERKNSEAYRGATDEYRELVEAVGIKNKILKDIIDHVRRIIWEINTMLMMRRS